MRCSQFWNLRCRRSFRYLAIGVAVFSVLLVSMYVGVMLRVRHRALTDYAAVLDGAKPPFATRATFLADGGTAIYHGWGYEIVSLRHMTIASAGGSGPRNRIIIEGKDLKFTCRDYFPFLERWLVDEYR